jgi:hypothetical protein
LRHPRAFPGEPLEAARSRSKWVLTGPQLAHGGVGCNRKGAPSPHTTGGRPRGRRARPRSPLYPPGPAIPFGAGRDPERSFVVASAAPNPGREPRGGPGGAPAARALAAPRVGRYGPRRAPGGPGGLGGLAAQRSHGATEM